MSDTDTRVREIIAEVSCRDAATITNETALADLDFDSLDYFDMAIGIEDQFDAVLDDTRILNLTTVQDVIDLLAASS